MDMQIPSCALDEQGLAEQRERYRRLAPSVADMHRDGDRLTIAFARAFDRRTLDELLAVEKECCPFFELDFDDDSRRLEVGVNDAKFGDALDAIAHQLSAREPGQRLGQRTVQGHRVVRPDQLQHASRR